MKDLRSRIRGNRHKKQENARGARAAFHQRPGEQRRGYDKEAERLDIPHGKALRGRAERDSEQLVDAAQARRVGDPLQNVIHDKVGDAPENVWDDQSGDSLDDGRTPPARLVQMPSEEESRQPEEVVDVRVGERAAENRGNRRTEREHVVRMAHDDEERRQEGERRQDVALSLRALCVATLCDLCVKLHN